MMHELIYRMHVENVGDYFRKDPPAKAARHVSTPYVPPREERSNEDNPKEEDKKFGRILLLIPNGMPDNELEDVAKSVYGENVDTVKSSADAFMRLRQHLPYDHVIATSHADGYMFAHFAPRFGYNTKIYGPTANERQAWGALIITNKKDLERILRKSAN